METEGAISSASSTVAALSGPTDSSSSFLNSILCTTLICVTTERSDPGGLGDKAPSSMIVRGEIYFAQFAGSKPSGILPLEASTRPSTILSRASWILPESIIFIMRFRSASRVIQKSVW